MIKMKKFLSKFYFLFRWSRNNNSNIYSNDKNLHYSSYGEDAILNYVFSNQNKGFYVDVGCYHPDYFSNTKK